MGVKLSSAKIKTGGRDRISVKDLFDLMEFPDQELHTMRPRGEIVALATHWFEVITKEGKKQRIGKTCRNIGLNGEVYPKGWDGKGGCAFCKAGHESRTNYYQNFIDVEDEDNAPRKLAPPTAEEKKAKRKLKGTKLWTPIKVLQFPPTVATTMQLITKKNKNKAGEVCELGDVNFGRALDISRDNRPGVAAANIWSVQKADQQMRKLNEEQRAYYMWDLNLLTKLIPTAAESKADLDYNVVGMIDADYEKLDLSEFPDLIAKREKAKKKSKSRRGRDDDQDQDQDDDDLPKKAKRRRAIESDDQDDDQDDQPKSRKSKPKKKKKFNLDDLF